jgi:transposase
MVAGTFGSLHKEGSMKMAKPIIISAGIDTSKDKLDTAIHGRAGGLVVENTPAGWQQLAAWLQQSGVERIGIEATGGYERGVLRYLQQVRFNVVLLQPLQVKAFAQMRLRRAKSDKLDAALIADFTHTMDATNKMPPDGRFDGLGELLTYIEQIEEDIARFKTRLEHMRDERVRQNIKDQIRSFTKQRLAEMRRLRDQIFAHADLKRRYNLVLSIPAIGIRTALSLVVRMPELGLVSREQAASLAGVAPFVQQSGKHQGQMHIGGGRARLRRSLFMAAFTGAFHWNPALMALYQRLVARGKGHKCAIIACARKLLIYANTVLARGTPWEKNSQLAAA